MADFPFPIVGFDLDGTLLDTLRDLGDAVNHALALIGRDPVPMDAVRGLIGGGARMMLSRALEVTGGPIGDDRFKVLSGELFRFHEAHIAVHTRPFPGTETMLDALAGKGVKLAVVTNKFERLAVKLLGQLGLASRFATIIGGDTLGPGRAKPAPDLLEEMLARLGSGTPETQRAAYVGDSSFDTRAARAAGLPCVAVSFGFNDLPPAELGASAIIDHYDQLLPTLESLA